MKYAKIVLASVMSVSVITGCTPNINADHYDTGDAQQVSVVKHGVIISISQVSVSDSKGNNLTGTIGGGLLGGIAGSTVGGGSGSALIAVGGALLGGIAGKTIEQKISSQTATQYIVQLTNGSTVAVTQGGAPIAVGTKVLLLEGDPARLIVDNAANVSNKQA